MRSSTKSWLLSGAVALSGLALAACSADGGSSDGDSGSADEGGATSDGSSDNDGGTQHDSSFSQDGGGQDTSVADTSAVDTSTGDVGVDTGSGEAASEAGVVDAADGGIIEAGADADDGGLPPVGSPCAQVNAIQTQSYGLCGFAERVCLAPDGGQPVWQPWGFCQQQVVNGCTPGTTTNEACGLCGTRVKQCQSNCTYAVGACTGQPLNACSPGAIDYEPGLSCDAGGRTRTCTTACAWGSFGTCEVPDGGSSAPTPSRFRRASEARCPRSRRSPLRRS